MTEHNAVAAAGADSVLAVASLLPRCALSSDLLAEAVDAVLSPGGSLMDSEGMWHLLVCVHGTVWRITCALVCKGGGACR